MPDNSSLSEKLARVTRLFERFCESYGLTVLAAQIDNHGSWEWSCCEVSDLNRFIVLNITEMPKAFGDASAYDVEVYAIAESKTRYTRQLVGTIQLEEWHFDHKLFAEVSDMQANWFWLELSRAWERARELTEADLTGEFITPRG